MKKNSFSKIGKKGPKVLKKLVKNQKCFYC